MEISIYNFKSIKELAGFDIKPLTVLSGVNSSGKSSFIQLLLLLKQTVELNSSNYPLVLKGEYVSINNYEDLIFKKDIKKNDLKIGFLLKKNDFDENDSERINIFDYLDDYKCEIEITFSFFKDKIYVKHFYANYILPEGTKKEQWIQFIYKANNIYIVKSNTGIFDETIWKNSREGIEGYISFNYFFPHIIKTASFDELEREEIEKMNEFGKDDDIVEIDGKLRRRKRLDIIPNLKGLQNVIESIFQRISYIGPIREEPKDFYYFKDISVLKIGNKGENTALILENEAENNIKFYKCNRTEDNIFYSEENDTLANAVEYWICGIFNLANNIKAEKYKESHLIRIIDHHGIKVSIKHVGFGISQILPTVVEGLRMPKDGIFVLEQPEIHLHPKVQSLLFDFLYSLTLVGKRIIIETHSSHFISRMRRRIAEDMLNQLSNNINLSFIEKRAKEYLFRKINLTDLGTLDYYPDDFIESPGKESQAIVKAQAKKRTKEL